MSLSNSQVTQKKGKRKTQQLFVINIEDFSGLTNGEADMTFPSVGREELEKNREKELRRENLINFGLNVP